MQSVQVMFKNKKRIVFYALVVYLAVGYVSVLVSYILANPIYLTPCPSDVATFKCEGVADLIRKLTFSNRDFWLQVLIWPIFLIAIFGGRT